MTRAELTMNGDLFGGEEGGRVELAPGALYLRGFALDCDRALLRAVAKVIAAAPLRHMTTPGDYRMSVAMTNCGEAGWVSDRHGYRYAATDPDSGSSWPALPKIFSELAARAATAAGYADFRPDACLVNRYEPGSRLSLHQDKNERNFSAPIVSVSLGLPAVFLFGGARRSDRPLRLALHHGDVVVWGGPSRLFYHGVAKLAKGEHPLTGAVRFNLTLRKAG